MKITKSQLKQIIAEELNEVYSEKQRRWACAQLGDDFRGESSLSNKEAKEMCTGPMKEEIIAETEVDLALLASSLDPETLEALKVLGQASWKVASEFLTPAALALFGASGVRRGLGYKDDTDSE